VEEEKRRKWEGRVVNVLDGYDETQKRSVEWIKCNLETLSGQLVEMQKGGMADIGSVVVSAMRDQSEGFKEDLLKKQYERQKGNKSNSLDLHSNRQAAGEEQMNLGHSRGDW